MNGVDVAVFIWSGSVTATILICGYKIHKKSKSDAKHYQHNFYHYMGNRHAQLEEEERPLVLALPEPRWEQPQRSALSRFAEAYRIEKEILEKKKAAERFAAEERKIRYTPTERLVPPIPEVEEPVVSEPEPEIPEVKVQLSLAQMRNTDDDLEVSMGYYDIVTDMLIELIKHSQMLEQRYPEVKLIRDTSKSGYPGLVSSNVLTKSQYDHAMADGGIFWEAGVLETNDKGKVVLALDHEYLLERWFLREGYEFEKEEEENEVETTE